MSPKKTTPKSKASKQSKRGKRLVIVESPAKARTLAGILGSEYDIRASVGHVRDLPKSKLGVDTEHGFEPRYLIPKEKRAVVETRGTYVSSTRSPRLTRPVPSTRA